MYLCENLHYIYENERLNPICERRKCKWQIVIRNKHQKELRQKQAKFLVMDVTARSQNQLRVVL